MIKYYSGVGSRETPLDVLIIMVKVANILEKKGFKLRSGAAKGSDSAFEFGVMDVHNNAEIYTTSHNARSSFKGGHIKPEFLVPEKDFPSLFNKSNKLISINGFHPSWDRNMQDYARKLHNRNVFQVLGRTLSDHPINNEFSKFLLCYTKDGAKKSSDTSRATGGTGTAIRVADFFNVPVFNLAVEEDLNKMVDFIKKNKELLDNEWVNNVVLYTDLNPNLKTIAELAMDMSCNPNQSKRKISI